MLQKKEAELLAKKDEHRVAEEEVQAIRLEMVSAEQIQAAALPVAGTQPLGAALRPHQNAGREIREAAPSIRLNRDRYAAFGRGSNPTTALVAALFGLIMVSSGNGRDASSAASSGGHIPAEE